MQSLNGLVLLSCLLAALVAHAVATTSAGLPAASTDQQGLVPRDRSTVPIPIRFLQAHRAQSAAQLQAKVTARADCVRSLAALAAASGGGAGNRTFYYGRTRSSCRYR